MQPLSSTGNIPLKNPRLLFPTDSNDPKLPGSVPMYGRELKSDLEHKKEESLGETTSSTFSSNVERKVNPIGSSLGSESFAEKKVIPEQLYGDYKPNLPVKPSNYEPKEVCELASSDLEVENISIFENFSCFLLEVLKHSSFDE